MFERVLVPLDGSELAAHSISVARGIAQAHGSTVHLLRVISREGGPGATAGSTTGTDVTPGQMGRNIAMTRQLEESRLQEALEYLEHFAFDLSHDGIEVRREALEGDADENIVSYARSNGIDLIVMTSHGYGGVKRMLMGSVTDKVVRSGVAPVLVVPSA